MKLFSKKLILLWLVALTGVPGMAQDSATGSFTLEECIDYALQHNANVKNERLNMAISKTQVGEIMAQGLPQINANGELNHNLEIPVSFLPGLMFQRPDVDFVPVPFGVPWQANANISASQMIFDGSYFVGLQAAKVYRELAEKDTRRTEIEVAEGVSLAYFGALVAEERLALLQNNLQRLDSLHRETQAMYQNGFAEAIDLQRVRVNLNNVRTQYNNVQRSLQVNLNALKFQMGMRLDRDIQLEQGIEDFVLQESPMEQNDFEYENRVEYQQLQVNRNLSRFNLKNNKIQYLPTLSAVANLGWNAGKPQFNELFEPTEDIPMDDGVMRARTWNRFMVVGLRVNVPIFDGLLKANRIRRNKLELEQIENQFVNLENSIDFEINQTYINLQNSLESLAAQQENMELAREVFRVSKIKYQQGVGSNLEVIEAENAFKEAETNYFNALYEALVARTSYRKATGTLYQK
jgi:outer membrane protein